MLIRQGTAVFDCQVIKKQDRFLAMDSSMVAGDVRSVEVVARILELLVHWLHSRRQRGTILS